MELDFADALWPVEGREIAGVEQIECASNNGTGQLRLLGRKRGIDPSQDRIVEIVSGGSTERKSVIVDVPELVEGQEDPGLVLGDVDANRGGKAQSSGSGVDPRMLLDANNSAIEVDPEKVLIGADIREMTQLGICGAGIALESNLIDPKLSALRRVVDGKSGDCGQHTARRTPRQHPEDASQQGGRSFEERIHRWEYLVSGNQVTDPVERGRD
jgi:hypothetical protein